ncbi:carbohydrate ABC transporter permease [Paenibacillus puldeungensis]|uniref:Carbohydrate ABC transporter permease n=1 Tax=Paenibacillus puldeungensis TaxID=696536 RepID=A0ABW3RTA4_9BACL
MNNKLIRPKNIVIYGFLMPGIIIYAFIVVIPMILAMRFSLFNWSGGPKMHFSGFGNYLTLVQDKTFWISLKNNLVIIFFSVIGQVGIGFLLSVFLSSKLVKFKGFHRTVIFIPVILSSVVIGFLWTMIYNKDYGLLNWALNSLHLSSLIQPWLDDPKIVIYMVTIPIVWQYIGLYMVIFMSSLQSIPKEILEVAELDGATGWKKTRYITFPLLYDTVKVAIMLCIAGNMKVFDHIFVMTGGGPGTSSTVMAQYAYNNSFVMFKLGYGSAVSIGIMVISLLLILVSRKLMGGNEK